MSTEVTAELVKSLRDRTGVSIGKCKEALVAAKGDIELAIANLRKAGIASAVKKEGRETREGQIVAAETANTIALAEINAETDFVVRNQLFQDFAKSVAEDIARTLPANLDALLNQKSSQDPSQTIDHLRANLVQTLGENIRLKRFQAFKKEASSSFGLYSHMGGKIVVLVEISGASDESELARDIAMHVAAESPDYLSPDEVPANIKAQEEEIARSQVKGKPDNIVAKIVEGKIKAFYDQSCLTLQKYVKDSELTVGELVSKRSKEAGKALVLKRFIRWSVGQEG